jgi:hypothetical protein
MINPDIRFALGRERQKMLLAEAETARQARQALLCRQQTGTPGARRWPPRRHPAWLGPRRSRLLGRWPRPAVKGTPVVLRDGSTVLIRQVHSVDATLLADGFARLSGRPTDPARPAPTRRTSPHRGIKWTG